MGKLHCIKDPCDIPSLMAAMESSGVKYSGRKIPPQPWISGMEVYRRPNRKNENHTIDRNLKCEGYDEKWNIGECRNGNEKTRV